MFTDKNTEASEKIMRDVNMLLECVNCKKCSMFQKFEM